MAAIPAEIAGCKRRVLCTPAVRGGRIHPHILAAAKLCGIDEVYAIGGAQAIAALAYGTETIPKVDKIVGPGSAWVTAAKQRRLIYLQALRRCWSSPMPRRGRDLLPRTSLRKPSTIRCRRQYC
jgi:hypothetical protein